MHSVAIATMVLLVLMILWSCIVTSDKSDKRERKMFQEFMARKEKRRMTDCAWQGESDKFVTNTKDTWENPENQKPKSIEISMYNSKFEVPSRDWLEGFYIAMMAAGEVVDERCYPSAVGDALRNVAVKAVNEYERERHGRQSEQGESASAQND